MPTFTELALFDTDKIKYAWLLKKALLQVQQGRADRFAYFKAYPFAKKAEPCVLIDYTPKCLAEIFKKHEIKPTAEGGVAMNPGKELQFDPEKGHLDIRALARHFVSLGNVGRVHIPAGIPDAAPARPQKEAGKVEKAVAPQPPADGEAGPARPAGGPKKRADMAPAPVKGVKVPLPEFKGNQGEAVDKYIESLEATPLFLKDADKQATLKQARALWLEDRFAEALEVLHPLVRPVTYEGVDAWVFDKPARKYQIEMVGEQLEAFVLLIESKRKTPAGEAALLGSVRQVLGVVKGFGAKVDAGLLKADPKAVKAAFDEWKLAVAIQKKLAPALRALWWNDQEARYRSEAGKSKSSFNVKVANSYGKEATLELAQMAEIQAIRHAGTHPESAKLLKKLEIAELAAIYGYTTADYSVINPMLRDGPPDSDAGKQEHAANLARFGPYIEAAVKGLDRLPPYKGPAVRCTKTMWADAIRQISETGRFVEKSFMSVGKTKVAGFGDVEWHIEKTTTGKDITAFSLHQSEGEVLFPPGSAFTFTRAEVPVAGGAPVEVKELAELAKHLTTETTAVRLYFAQTG